MQRSRKQALRPDLQVRPARRVLKAGNPPDLYVVVSSLHLHCHCRVEPLRHSPAEAVLIRKLNFKFPRHSSMVGHQLLSLPKDTISSPHPGDVALQLSYPLSLYRFLRVHQPIVNPLSSLSRHLRHMPNRMLGFSQSLSQTRINSLLLQLIDCLRSSKRRALEQMLASLEREKEGTDLREERTPARDSAACDRQKVLQNSRQLVGELLVDENFRPDKRNEALTEARVPDNA
mmetsp:Transcript_13496/g.46962  ORF Transcript_13496/g.46962 Transcript_13496/m.46962 type:complete len:231 (-) Transcript_13496:1526-2218(-)